MAAEEKTKPVETDLEALSSLAKDMRHEAAKIHLAGGPIAAMGIGVRVMHVENAIAEIARLRKPK